MHKPFYPLYLVWVDNAGRPITWPPRPPSRAWPSNRNQLQVKEFETADSAGALAYNGPNPSPVATMRFLRLFTFGWVTLPWVLLIAVVLVDARRPPPLPRSFRELSTDEVSWLVDGKDPLKGLDPNDPNSHLSKILIPRPGEWLLFLKHVVTILIPQYS